MSTARSNQLASPGALRYVSTVASAAAAASPAAMKTGDESARRSSPCSKTYGEYLKKNANSESNTVLSADLCSQWRLSGHSTSRWPFVQRGVRTLYIGRSMFRLVATIVLVSAGAATLLAQSPAILRWAGDAEGGAPFVEADPTDPSRVVGFDVEIAELIAKGLGRDAALRRGRLHLDRSVDRPRRRRHRPERHRGHAGAAGRLRRHPSVLPVPRSAERPRGRRRTVSYARRSARAARRHAGRHDRLRHPARGRARPRHRRRVVRR